MVGKFRDNLENKTSIKMNEILDHFEEEEKLKYPYDSTQIDESNWIRMFLSNSRLAFTYLLNRDNTNNLILLFTLSVFMSYANDEESIFNLLIPNFPSSGLIAVIFTLISAATLTIIGFVLYWKVGHWMGGTGSLKAVITVSLWSNIPFLIMGLPSSFAEIMHDLGFEFQSIFVNINFDSPLYLLVSFTFMIWGLILTIRGLSVAHKFESGTSCLVLILTGFILMIPLLFFMSKQGYF